MEVPIQFVKHFSSGVAVLLPDHPFVGRLVALLEDPFGREAPSQRIEVASLAWDDNGKDTARPQDPCNLFECGRQVVKVFENMDGENPIERVVIPRKSLLTIGDHDR
jgi:hypothetical protein